MYLYICFEQVELELGMDIGASTYCFPRGEQIAHAVDQGVEGTSNQKSFFQRFVQRSFDPGNTFGNIFS